jgi:hypothetical protein
MAKQGFVALHRSLLDWEWYQDEKVKSLFIHLLLTANFENKKWRGVEVKRGDVVIGRSALAKSISLTEREIRTALTKLKTTNEITIKTTNKFSIITLVNYGIYQDVKTKSDQQNDQQTVTQETNKRPTNDQQTTTTKQLKQCNNENNPLTPDSGEVDFKYFEGGIGELEKLLDQETNELAKKNAPKWDMIFLKGQYVSFLKRKGLPTNIKKAFPAYCFSITKGKEPI